MPLTVYGVGTMVGGGIYALVGKVAGTSGTLAPSAFLLAATVALFSAFSFAELSARFPVSAGPSRFVQEAFGVRVVSQVVGALVIATGVVSAATLVVAMSGFVEDLVGLPPWMGSLLVVGVLVGIVAWGIDESVTLVGLITVLEVGTLLAIVALRHDVLATLPERWGELVPADVASEGTLVLAGAFLAFYAFLGFEDMVTVAEEVEQPARTMPRAILLALGLTSLLYVLIAIVAVLAVPSDVLGEAHTPIALLVGDDSPNAVAAVGVVSLLASANGALVQVLMAARVVYGMAREGRAPAWLGAVTARTRTPVRATLGVGLVVLALSSGFPLMALARATSGIILVVFAVVNVALVVVRLRASGDVDDAPRFPLAIPVIGALLCVGLFAARVAERTG